MVTGAEIKAAREKLGMTQEELAKFLGILPIGIDRIENYHHDNEFMDPALQEKIVALLKEKGLD